MEKRDYRGPRKEVSVCKVSPGTYGEGPTGILGLDRVCITCVSASEKHWKQSRRWRCEMEIQS